MRLYSTECISCGQSGPRRPSAAEARAAFRGHYCPTVRSADDGAFRTAKSAVNLVIRGRYLDSHSYQECVSDALYGIARARLRFDPDLGTWEGYAFGSAVNAVRDGMRERMPLTRGQWNRGVRHADELPAWLRPAVSGDALREEYPNFDVAAPAGELELRHVEMSDYIDWLLGFVEGREREVLVRHFLGEQTLAQIGAYWRVTESRVCQIKQVALREVRAAATAAEGEWGEPVTAAAQLESWAVERAA